MADERVAGGVSPVVYDLDDRIEWYEIPTQQFRDIAAQSTLALVPATDLPLTPGSTFPPFADTVMSLANYIDSAYEAPLCAGSAFAAQPTAASCSGTLIDDDLVLTAGHCVRSQAICEQYKFVFDYHYTSAGTLASIGPDDTYRCGNVVVREEQVNPHIDYAVVRLDRPVVGRIPVDIRAATSALAMNSTVIVLGHGTGLPLKYDSGGRVTRPNASSLDAFVASTDTFAGNSGSGVFDTSGEMVGILVSGEEDYVETSAACIEVNMLTEAQAGEEIVYAFRAIDALCDGGYPSSACPANPAPLCGDDFCSGGETAATCAVDCVGGRCADGTCGSGETHDTCPYDCVASTARPARPGRCATSPTSRSHEAALALALCALALRARRARRS